MHKHINILLGKVQSSMQRHINNAYYELMHENKCYSIIHIPHETINMHNQFLFNYRYA